MGLQGPADWMVVPVTAGPVDDEHPAGQLEAERDEEECSPAVTHLVKHNMTTQLRHEDLNKHLTTANKVVWRTSEMLQTSSEFIRDLVAC